MSHHCLPSSLSIINVTQLGQNILFCKFCCMLVSIYFLSILNGKNYEQLRNSLKTSGQTGQIQNEAAHHELPPSDPYAIFPGLCEIVWNSSRIILTLFQNKYPRTALVQPQSTRACYEQFYKCLE